MPPSLRNLVVLPPRALGTSTSNSQASASTPSHVLVSDTCPPVRLPTRLLHRRHRRRPLARRMEVCPSEIDLFPHSTDRPRFYILRRNNRPSSQFFSFGRHSYQPSVIPPGQVGWGPQHPPSNLPLTPLPASYRPSRRVRAVDTDAGGRRGGHPDDPDWDGKDVLPVYDNVGSPPKYHESTYPLPSLAVAQPTPTVPVPRTFADGHVTDRQTGGPPDDPPDGRPSTTAGPLADALLLSHPTPLPPAYHSPQTA